MTANLDLALAPTVEGLGYELVDVEFVRSGRSALLRLYIDKENGVTIDDCVLVSRQVGALLDVEDLVHGAYRLEVSSPGLNRPLKKPQDFVRFAGETAQVHLHVLVEGRKRFKGVLKGFEEGGVVLECDGEEMRFLLADIAKARLAPELNSSR